MSVAFKGLLNARVGCEFEEVGFLLPLCMDWSELTETQVSTEHLADLSLFHKDHAADRVTALILMGWVQGLEVTAHASEYKLYCKQ